MAAENSEKITLQILLFLNVRLFLLAAKENEANIKQFMDDIINPDTHLMRNEVFHIDPDQQHLRYHHTFTLSGGSILIYHLNCGKHTWSPTSLAIENSMKSVGNLIEEKRGMRMEQPDASGSTSSTGSVACVLLYY
ncbi:hypothetical protein LOD99_1528 [Oopsacas minuta]|uniref:Uncharacterized protein n=1 Tax=Oopsacas minuta TaxID=111878 RepID=A0AAV7K5T8_9METZ|nr:hypothetical protein LOD99_1528 [Oopsacas minuta]